MDKRLLAEIMSAIGRKKKEKHISAETIKDRLKKRKSKKLASNKSRKINQEKARHNKFTK